MRFSKHLLIFALGSFGLVAEGMAQDCQTRKLPDGTWTTECPSQSPTRPPAIIPAQNVDATCRTPYGDCTVRFQRAPDDGAPCSCLSGDEPVRGTVWMPSVPSSR
jgi:hypothetical protein